jgi:hypothetical protein
VRNSETIAASVRSLEVAVSNRGTYRAIMASILLDQLKFSNMTTDVANRVAFEAVALGGDVGACLDALLDILMGTEADALVVAPLVLSAIESGKPAIGCALEQRLREFNGAGLCEVLTAKAIFLAEDGRYAEAADCLEVQFQLPVTCPALHPVFSLHRLSVWSACTVEPTMAALDPATGQIELPEELRARAFRSFDIELERMAAVVWNVPMLQAALAIELLNWSISPHGHDAIANDRLSDSVNQCAEKLIAGASAGASSISEPDLS